MSGKGRKGYAAALAAALVVLVVSAGAAIAYFADGGGPDGTAAGQPTASPSWPSSRVGVISRKVAVRGGGGVGLRSNRASSRPGCC